MQDIPLYSPLVLFLMAMCDVIAHCAPTPTNEQFWKEIEPTKIQTRLVIHPETFELNSPPECSSYLKVVCISDTHDKLDEIEDLPLGDILIHAGDWTTYGNIMEIERFNKQMARFPHKHKLVIAGNHEFGLDPHEDESRRSDKYKGAGTRADGGSLLSNMTYLQDSYVEIDGLTFYGAPWHIMSGFPFFQNDTGMGKAWSRIPEKTDVLITHSPPIGYLDDYNGERRGCRHLLREIEERVQPSFHVFGHVHEGYGAVTNGKTVFINASQMRKGKRLERRPVVFYIPTKKEQRCIKTG